MEQQPARRRGRPRKHPDAKAASRASSAAYRQRQRERRSQGELSSDIIDLSEIPPWRRR